MNLKLYPIRRSTVITAACIFFLLGTFASQSFSSDTPATYENMRVLQASNLLPLLLLGALLLGLGGAIYYVYSRRRTLMEAPVSSERHASIRVRPDLAEPGVQRRRVTTATPTSTSAPPRTTRGRMGSWKSRAPTATATMGMV